MDGAVIASGTGNLGLSTGTLSVTDLQDHDRGSSLDVTVGGNVTTGGSDGKGQPQPTTTPDGRPVGASISGQVADHDKEGVSRGTIGAGTITIRDPAHQTQDVASINRDPSQAQAVTKDTSSGVKFYGSDSSVREIAGGFQGIQEGAEQIGQAARDGFKDLPAQVQVTVEKIASNIDLSASTVDDAIRTIIDALVTNGNISRDQAESAKELGIKAYYQDSAYTALGGDTDCGKQGFNLLDLLFPPAYAQASVVLKGICVVAKSAWPYIKGAAGWVAKNTFQKIRPGNLSKQNNLYKSALKNYKKSDLTEAGRALTKHPEIIGLSKQNVRSILKTDAALNDAASSIIKNIIRNGEHTTVLLNRYGKTTQIIIPNKFGARWYQNGKFIGFINP